MSATVPLRPHHALCVRFFEGKGYSEDFVRHMARTIAFLTDSDPAVTLRTGCDCICERCPNRAGDGCASESKVRAIDDRALAILRYRAGDEVRWSELYEQAKDRIIARGRLKEVCRDCQWLYLCEG